MFSRKDSYDDLIDLFVEIGELKTKRIIKAFRKVRRKDFLPDYQINNAGADKALSIGHEQTNSQPRVVVRMLEWLQPQPGDRVLDLGSGSAWTTALLSNIVGRKGTVFGVERIDELVKFGRDNLGKRRNAKIIKANKRLGLPDEAPFDKILVSASCKKLPRELLGQLKWGGRLVIPIETDVFGDVWVVQLDTHGNKNIEVKKGYAFVRLVH